jgi:cytoplasmic iron level regulating protein YaaA (DUF328/UPF0246 family)
VRIVSALWGLVSPADQIPAYRLSMGTTLGRLGTLASFWRSQLRSTLDDLARDSLVIDCRSSDYAAVWRASPRSLAVRVEEIRGGKRVVVSHNAKHARGLLTGALVATANDVESPEQIAHVAAGLPGVTAAELSPGRLTLVTDR